MKAVAAKIAEKVQPLLNIPTAVFTGIAFAGFGLSLWMANDAYIQAHTVEGFEDSNSPRAGIPYAYAEATATILFARGQALGDLHGKHPLFCEVNDMWTGYGEARSKWMFYLNDVNDSRVLATNIDTGAIASQFGTRIIAVKNVEKKEVLVENISSDEIIEVDGEIKITVDLSNTLIKRVLGDDWVTADINLAGSYKDDENKTKYRFNIDCEREYWTNDREDWIVDALAPGIPSLALLALANPSMFSIESSAEAQVTNLDSFVNHPAYPTSKSASYP